MQAAVPLMVASAVVGAAGTVASGFQNASVFNAQAREEQAMGVAERTQIRAASRAQMGVQVIRQAESGFAPGMGSALADLEESLVNRELDLLMSKRNANTRAAGLKAQAKMAKIGGIMGGVSQLLGGAAAVGQHSSQMAAAGS